MGALFAATRVWRHLAHGVRAWAALQSGALACARAWASTHGRRASTVPGHFSVGFAAVREQLSLLLLRKTCSSYHRTKLACVHRTQRPAQSQWIRAQQSHTCADPLYTVSSSIFGFKVYFVTKIITYLYSIFCYYFHISVDRCESINYTLYTWKFKFASMLQCRSNAER